MNEAQFKEALDRAEAMGYQRGVLTIFTQIFRAMEEEGMQSVSYRSLKTLFDETKKLFDKQP